MRIKYAVTGILLAAVMIVASGCNSRPEFVDVGENGSRTKDKLGFQFDKPKKGEEIAVITTSEGIIKLRIFDKSAPIAAKNFKLLIKSKAYDGSTFHRVIDEFMIQGGKTAAGTSAWGDNFGYEFNKNLRHFNGALAMAHSDNPNTNSSEFYIVQNSEMDLENESNSGPMEVFEKEAVKLYKKHGGTPWLDGEYNPSGGHTVFGQVFQGMDIVDKIAAAEVIQNEDGSTDNVPAKEITIKKIRLEKYGK